MPCHIVQPAAVRCASIEVIHANDRVSFAKLNDPPPEAQHVSMLLLLGPIQPADFVVLAISVVISTLSISCFIARNKHRYATRKHQDRRKVANLLLAQLLNSGILRLALHPTVPTQVFVVAVVVAFSVGFIMFAVVRNQIVQRKTIMTINKIDAVGRFAATSLVKA